MTDGFCPDCGEALASKGAACAKCSRVGTETGTIAPEIARPATPDTPNLPGKPPIEYKTESTTLILSILVGLIGFNGVGHMCLGNINKGIKLRIGGIILYVAGFVTLFFVVGIGFLIAYIGLFFWQIMDARKMCRLYNEELSKTGSPPW